MCSICVELKGKTIRSIEYVESKVNTTTYSIGIKAEQYKETCYKQQRNDQIYQVGQIEIHDIKTLMMDKCENIRREWGDR